MQFKRVSMALVGVVTTAFSVGAFKFASFGVDPFQSFMTGINHLLPLDFGTLYMLVNGILLLFALMFDRRYIGIATFINLFLLGYIVEFALHGLRVLFPEASLYVRVASFMLGFVFLCFGASLYMTANLGVSTYDAIALICAHKWKLGKFMYIRIITDFACIACGIGLYLLAGGSVLDVTAFAGIGTILTAFFMGPLIDLFNRKIAQPLLARE